MKPMSVISKLNPKNWKRKQAGAIPVEQPQSETTSENGSAAAAPNVDVQSTTKDTSLTATLDSQIEIGTTSPSDSKIEHLISEINAAKRLANEIIPFVDDSMQTGDTASAMMGLTHLMLSSKKQYKDTEALLKILSKGEKDESAFLQRMRQTLTRGRNRQEADSQPTAEGTEATGGDQQGTEEAGNEHPAPVGQAEVILGPGFYTDPFAVPGELVDSEQPVNHSPSNQQGPSQVTELTDEQKRRGHNFTGQ